jgi:peptidoglycan hydrolase-like protein with peptidoglycan-binding domain
MKQFSGILVMVGVVALLAAALTGCVEKKSEMPIGEIMTNTTNAVSAQNAAVVTAPEVVTAPVIQPETMAVPAVETMAAYVAPTPDQIQTALKNAGYYKGTIDGKIGPKSIKAIEAFQNDNGLKADGKVGRKTWEILQVHLNKATTTSVTTQPIAD